MLRGKLRALCRVSACQPSFCVVFAGKVLDGLESLGLKAQTAVVFHGDHGWQLGAPPASLVHHDVASWGSLKRAQTSWALLSAGEHDSWHKFTNFELGEFRILSSHERRRVELLLSAGTRVPLIIRAPWIAASIGKKAEILAELIDVFPTIAALAGTPDPHSGIDGISLVPVLQTPAVVPLPSRTTGNKSYAYSQYP